MVLENYLEDYLVTILSMRVSISEFNDFHGRRLLPDFEKKRMWKCIKQ